MDPFAHTLFGAALAEAGLRRASRCAVAAALIGANLPDVDVLAHLWGHDAALYARRGWTHGVLAMALMPPLLTAALLLYARWRGATAQGAPPMRPGRLLAVACVAVWSHPLLDWLNTYGIRLLMPFDGRWFYGDALFIVDPWLWLMLAAGVVLARSARMPAKTAWGVLAAIATWLIVSGGLPAGVVAAWCVGVMVIAWLCWRVPRVHAGRLSQVGLVAALAYGAVLFGLARHAEARAAERYPGAQAVQASPMAGLPNAHRVVVVHADRYRVIQPDGTVRELLRAPIDETVRRALADPSMRGFATWTRLPWWQVEPDGDGWRVRFHDLRYSQPGARGGIGYADVHVLREELGAADGQRR